MMRVAVLVCATLALLLPARGLAKPDKADPADPIFPPGTSKHVSDWIKELRSSDDEKVRQKALVAMKLIGPKIKGVVPAVCDTMKEDKVVTIRVDAALLLGEFGRGFKDDSASDTKVMVDALQSVLVGDGKAAEESIREAAASSMGNMGRDARDGLPALIEALKDKAKKVQTAAAYSILNLAGDKSDPDKPRTGIVVVDAHDPMLVLLKDSTAPVLARCAAARFVTQQEVDGRITALTDVLADDKNDARLRKTAADMLGTFKEREADDAVPALAKALTDKDDELRIAAGGALARVGPRAKDALTEVRKALKDTNATVRHRAMYICLKLERDAVDAVPDLMSSLKVEKVIENRITALRALGAIGPPAKDAVTIITEYTTNANPDVRKAATEALAKIQS